MMLFLSLLLLLVQPGGQAPAASPASSSVPAAVQPAAPAAPFVAEDPAVTKRAKEWLHRMQTGDIDRSQLEAQMSAALKDDLVKKTATALAPLGEPQSFVYVNTLTNGDITTAVYRLAFPNGKVLWIFSFDKSGLIAGFYLRPDAQI
jgi:hypothetical protein